MTNWERSPPSGVRLPWLFRGGVISSEGRGSRVDDWGVSARGRGVVFLDGGFVVLGNKENPPVAPVDGDAILFAGYKLPFSCLYQTETLASCAFRCTP